MSRLKKALEKAKEARGDRLEGLVRPVETPPPEPEPAEKPAPHQQYSPLKPKYTSTTVVSCDSEMLRRNKVIAVCTQDSADRMKILRTQILNQMSEEGKNTLLVTSANPGEGKTLTAINLAISCSHQLNKTVMLVDGDIKKPSVHAYLGLENGPGLADCLTQKAEVSDVLINPGMDRIVILRGGSPHTNSAELLGSPRMGALLKEIKERYPDRFIIFDSAPVLSSADPLVFANLVDGILLVVEAEKTKREDIQKVFEMMQNKPIIGTVFNKVID
ncbi:polysaccharide biosynthesis tyrosine autokinase [bacterium]|nr:polysaccharide biosynthesis tyrosine autokinase [bacterium]